MKQSKKTQDGTLQQTQLFAEGSHNDHANHSAKQAKDLEKKMTATSGRKCLEQLEKFNQITSWQKMFTASLIGMKGWYSTKCRLTWKMKGTKYRRLYFQLVPSTLPIDGIESGLLPTPIVMDTNQGDLEKIDKRREKAKAKGINGNGFGMTVGELANRGLLPTPRVADVEGGKAKDGKILDLPATINKKIGKTSQLNPQFVMEMMGFPPNWTELPFLSGETNQLKPEETQ